MAYGTSDGVEFYLGRTGADASGYFTAANITLAITDADLIVDYINSDADSSLKTIASNMIAADLLFNRFALALTNGLDSTSGVENEPSTKLSTRKIPSDLVLRILNPGPEWSYSTTTAKDANDNYYG